MTSRRFSLNKKAGDISPRPFTFTHHPNPPVLSEIEQINSESDGRKYKTPDGMLYPSVTTLLGSIGDSTWLDDWKKRIGEERAQEIVTQAGVRGSAFHDLAERYLRNDVDWAVGHMPVNIGTFYKVMPLLHRISNIRHLESRLYSHILRAAGTADVIADFDGVLSVIDFKTSRTKKNPEGYFMQKSCYALMYEELTGVRIDQIVTIVADDRHDEGILYVSTKTEWLKKFIIERKKLPDWKTY